MKSLINKHMRQISIWIFIVFTFWTYSSCHSNAPYQEGKLLYEQHCWGCHGKNGEGLELLIPPLAKADMLLNAGPSVACWIRNGMQGKIIVNGKEFENVMPANKKLNETEITNICNFILNSWGNKHEYISLEQVKQQLENCK